MANIPQIQEYTGDEPITLAEAKAYLRVDHTTDNDYITELIKIARLQVLKDTNQSLVETSIIEYRDDWPSDNYIQLQYPSKVTNIALFYQKSLSVYQTLTEDVDYTRGSNVNNADGRIEILKTYDLATDINGITIAYKTDIVNPDTARPLKIAMYMLIQHFYDNRSPVSYLKVDEMPLAYKHLITQYKRYTF